MIFVLQITGKDVHEMSKTIQQTQVRASDEARAGVALEPRAAGESDGHRGGAAQTGVAAQPAARGPDESEGPAEGGAAVGGAAHGDAAQAQGEARQLLSVD